MISRTNFYLTPYFKYRLLNDQEVRLLLKRINMTQLSPSLVFKKNSNVLDLKIRNSSSILFNYKKIEKKLLGLVYKNLKSLDDTLTKNQLSEIEILQFAHYKRGNFFDWHRDTYFRSSKKKNRILTMVVLLSDHTEYKGGHLELIDYTNRKLKFANLQKGDVVVFPSDYYHRITPIRSGRRMSVTAWLIGESMSGMHSLQDS